VSATDAGRRHRGPTPRYTITITGRDRHLDDTQLGWPRRNQLRHRVTGTGFIPGAPLAASVLRNRHYRQLPPPTSTAPPSTRPSPSPPTRATGARTITLTNGDGSTATGTNVFTVNAAPNRSPHHPSTHARNAPGISVVITGSGFVSGLTVTLQRTGPARTHRHEHNLNSPPQVTIVAHIRTRPAPTTSSSPTPTANRHQNRRIHRHMRHAARYERAACAPRNDRERAAVDPTSQSVAPTPRARLCEAFHTARKGRAAVQPPAAVRRQRRSRPPESQSQACARHCMAALRACACRLRTHGIPSFRRPQRPRIRRFEDRPESRAPSSPPPRSAHRSSPRYPRIPKARHTDQRTRNTRRVPATSAVSVCRGASAHGVAVRRNAGQPDEVGERGDRTLRGLRRGVDDSSEPALRTPARSEHPLDLFDGVCCPQRRKVGDVVFHDVTSFRRVAVPQLHRGVGDVEGVASDGAPEPGDPSASAPTTAMTTFAVGGAVGFEVLGPVHRVEKESGIAPALVGAPRPRVAAGFDTDGEERYIRVVLRPPRTQNAQQLEPCTGDRSKGADLVRIADTLSDGGRPHGRAAGRPVRVRQRRSFGISSATPTTGLTAHMLSIASRRAEPATPFKPRQL